MMYRQILVPIDLNEKGFANKAIEIAVWHAKKSNAELHLLNVVPSVQFSTYANYIPDSAEKEVKTEITKKLNKFAAKYVDEAVIYHTHISEGKTYAVILDHAERLGADLIIMPSHRRASTTDKVNLGSVTSRVVEYSPINVLVVKPELKAIE